MTAARALDPTFWSGRRVLVTGHTGFKGSWLCSWLVDLGAEVLGVSLDGTPARPRLWEDLALPVHEVLADVADTTWHDATRDFAPEVVLHLAAQSLVPAGYADPLGTFRTNVMGTAQVLALLPSLTSLAAAVIITTDKVYDPRQPTPHSEGDYLGGKDPYSASKAAAELVVATWPLGDLPVAAARAGNVVGGGDTAADRLVPDVVRSWADGRPVPLRNPTAVRPWQHVLEPLHGYLLQAEALAAGGDRGPLNFGPEPGQLVTVTQVVERAARTARDAGQTVPDPAWDTREVPITENPSLEIASDEARSRLGWRNLLSWEQTVDWTMEWYARRAGGEDALALVQEQVAAYRALVDEASA